jgi:predicted DNA-binding protein (MmcQ/YjbR family)
MDHKRIADYGLSKPGTSLRYPFDPDLPVLFVADRMFALLGKHQSFPSVNLKAEPETAWLLREKYPGSVLPGYHMNKRHWNTVVLNGTIPDREVLEMVDESYQLVCAKLPKSVRNGLLQG